MKDEAKGIGLGIGIVTGCIIGASFMFAKVNSNISALDTKLESIFYFTKEVRLTLFQETCHNLGGIYTETKEGGRCDKIEAYKSHLQGYSNFSEKDSYLLSEKTCSVYKNTSNSMNISVYSGSKEALEKNVVPLCLKWKEAQDVLRKKNYKEYACKTLDTFEDYLACNEK